MTSIQSQVSEVFIDNESMTLKDMKKKFSTINPETIKSCYYRARKVSKLDETVATSGKITMEYMEGLLMKQVNKRKDVPTLRLMVDFLKIKQQDHSELEEIDLELFYKKAMED